MLDLEAPCNDQASISRRKRTPIIPTLAFDTTFLQHSSSATAVDDNLCRKKTNTTSSTTNTNTNTNTNTSTNTITSPRPPPIWTSSIRFLTDEELSPKLSSNDNNSDPLFTFRGSRSRSSSSSTGRGEVPATHTYTHTHEDKNNNTDNRMNQSCHSREKQKPWNEDLFLKRPPHLRTKQNNTDTTKLSSARIHCLQEVLRKGAVI